MTTPAVNEFTCSVEVLEPLSPSTRRVLLSVQGQIEFHAGQYLEILLPDGRGCPFSIASSPAASAIELHIRPTPGSSDSNAVTRIIEGDRPFRIIAPKGDCYLTEVPTQPLILIAAATGITQMKSILDYLCEAGCEEAVFLYWGVTAPSDLYLDEKITEWERGIRNFHYTPVLSVPDSYPDWTGRTGLVVDAVVEDLEDLFHYSAVVSGGPAMVSATAARLEAAGMSRSNIRSDLL